MKYGLKEDNIKDITNIFLKHSKVKKAILYGSRAKGNFRTGSDIDVTLVGENLNLKELNKISLDLDELYLPYSFDISIFEKIQNKELIEHINRVGIIIYEMSIIK